MIICPPHSIFLLGMKRGVFSLRVLDILVNSHGFGDASTKAFMYHRIRCLIRLHAQAGWGSQDIPTGS